MIWNMRDMLYSTVFLLLVSNLKVSSFVTSSLREGIFLDSKSSISARYAFVNRRKVIDVSFWTAFGALVATSPALSEDEVENLSMPSSEETKLSDEEAMAKRLKLKAELQKKNSMSTKISFADSMKREKEKQAGMKMSQQERRDIL